MTETKTANQTENKTITIAVIGGGVVGSLAAYSLAQAFSSAVNVSIQVFEKHPRPQQNGQYEAQYNARNIVLSSISAACFNAMGLWQELESLLVPIDSLQISRYLGACKSTIHAKEEGIKALGYVADLSQLAAFFTLKAEGHPLVSLHFETELKKIQPKTGGYSLEWAAGQKSLQQDFDLVVVADGQNSQVCESLGITGLAKPYNQHALVANISMSRPMPNVAYEQFIPGGAITLLPLNQKGFESRMALVWIDHPKNLEKIKAMSENAFLQKLSQYLPIEDAAYSSKGHSDIYPLNFQMRNERVRPHLVVIGNAAQSLHPVAAQGFNLAVRDIRDFVTCVQSQFFPDGYSFKAEDIQFSGAFMSNFAEQRVNDVNRVRGFVDVLTQVFFKSSVMPLRGLFQDAALAGFELIPGVKRGLSEFAMGGKRIK